MGGGDSDAVRRVERARRELNRLHIQPQGTTQQFTFNHHVFHPHDISELITGEATLFARRVYVDGLPPSANEQKVRIFFNQVMAVIGGNFGPGDAVRSVWMNDEQRFALVEFRLAGEASNAMALDGILFEGMPLKVRRPADYNASKAAAMGPSQPSPKLNLAAVGLRAGSAGGGLEDHPDRIFVGGLPYHYTEAQVRELLESFGRLRGLEIVKDRESGNSKGYAFCVYMDTTLTDIACAALNGTQMGDKIVTVRRANQSASASQPRPEQESFQLKAQQQKLPNPVGVPATKVVCLVHVVSADDLKDDEAYEDIMDDIRQEACRYGNLVKVVIPRPDPKGHLVTGVGKVFLEYTDVCSATRAKMALRGRKVDGKPVVANYYPELKFANLDFDA